MYEVPDFYLTEPREGDVIGFCAECDEDIVAGQDIWEIKGDWYCESCISFFRETKYEKENCFESAV